MALTGVTVYKTRSRNVNDVKSMTERSRRRVVCAVAWLFVTVLMSALLFKDLHVLVEDVSQSQSQHDSGQLATVKANCAVCSFEFYHATSPILPIFHPICEVIEARPVFERTLNVLQVVKYVNSHSPPALI